ncbi:hypothetical protein OG474_25360 [Kribbella sp. NBC_01505]|uniref:hypothetical protein n=1 Tax=Kribbella sp. NBC_01505 TaxID=2903580 RepID=UPI003869D79A
MRSSSSRGRYRAGCGLAGCSSGSDPRSSKLEAEIFNLLDFMIGGGAQDVRFPWDGRLRIDMLFELPSRFRLAVEYDGAYWHQGKESSDIAKAERLVDSGFVHAVVRLRESPLPTLSSLDVAVPPNASSRTVAQLALLHMLHTFTGPLAYREYEIRAFLETAPEPPPRSAIVCRRCLKTGIPARARHNQRLFTERAAQW